MTTFHRGLLIFPKVDGDGDIFISIREKQYFRDKKNVTNNTRFSLVHCPARQPMRTPEPEGSAGARSAPDSNRELARHLTLLSCRGLVIALVDPTIGVKCKTRLMRGG